MPSKRRHAGTGRGSDKRKLMTYLGARTVHRFESGRITPGGLLRHRVRLVLLVAVVLGVGLWGLWREFVS